MFVGFFNFFSNARFSLPMGMRTIRQFRLITKVCLVDESIAPEKLFVGKRKLPTEDEAWLEEHGEAGGMEDGELGEQYDTDDGFIGKAVDL